MQGIKSSGRQHYGSKKGDMFGTSSLSRGFFVRNQQENDFTGYELKDVFTRDQLENKSVMSETVQQSLQQLPTTVRRRKQQTQVVTSQWKKQEQESLSQAAQQYMQSPQLSTTRNAKKYKKRAGHHHYQLSQNVEIIDDQALMVHDQIVFSKPVELEHIQEEKTHSNNSKQYPQINCTHYDNKQQKGLFHFDDDDDGMDEIWGDGQTKKTLQMGKQIGGGGNNNSSQNKREVEDLEQQVAKIIGNTESDGIQEKKKKKPKYQIIFEPSQLSSSGQQQQIVQKKQTDKASIQSISNSDNNNSMQMNTLSPTPITTTNTSTKTSKPLTPEHLLKVVTYPVSPTMLMRTNIIRSSGFFNLYPQYHVHFQPDKTHLLSAKKVSRAPYSTFIISNSKQNFEQNSPHYLGKAKGSVIGDQLDIFGPGLNPTDALQQQVKPRQFLATIIYGTRILQSGTPRNFTVYMKHPQVDYYQAFHEVQMYADEIPLHVLYQNPNNRDKIIVLRNKKPQYSVQLKAYSLNFNGRARVGSVKNFILEYLNAQQNTSSNQVNKPVLWPMLFGKMGDNEFNMDISSPLSPMIAFGIALSSFDDKFFCE